MKDLKTKINEAKQETLTSTTINLIDALKEWTNYGTSNAKDIESPFIKEFEKQVASFINDTIINADYMDPAINNLINHYKLDVKEEDDWTKVQEAFVKYVLEK